MQSIFTKLHADGLLTDDELNNISATQKGRLFSLHWELKTMLYLGVVLLSGGLGILIYKNIDTIGHQAILLFIALVSAACFFYCTKNKLPFSTQKVQAQNSFFDYVLLLGALLLVSFIGYLQFAYNVFGTKYGLATFIPMLLLFCIAYYFDHLGILSMAIVLLATWAGIAVTPTRILVDNDFDSVTIIGTGFALGVLLVAAGYFSVKRKIKSHFEFTYTNFGAHLLFIAALAAMFHFDAIYALLLLILAAVSFFFYRKAMKEKSFYFLLILSLYSYIGVSYVIVRFLDAANLDIGSIYLACIYFIASAIGLILFLIRKNKAIKAL